MSACMRTAPRMRNRTTWRSRGLAFEILEARTLPSATTWPGLTNPIFQTGQNATLDQAVDLGDLSSQGSGQAIGTITNPSTGGGDIEWYSFTLDHAASVSLATLDKGNSPFVSVLSLYNADVGDAGDPYNPTGYRLLAQDDGAARGGDAHLTRMLAAGTYFVAVSGSGNLYFHPFIADSGSAASTGDYGLLVGATDLGVSANDGPVVLAADPATGATTTRSPFVVRVDLSAPLDPNSVVPGDNVKLVLNPNGSFGTNADQTIALAGFNFSTTVNELQVFPAAPLVPGYYELILSGTGTGTAPALTGPSGSALGQNALHPQGQDYKFTFHVAGSEGIPGLLPSADDTAATAHQLGDISNVGLVRIAGSIGVDPTDSIPFNPSSVDLYHFVVQGPGRYSFQTEVYAGRIGSPLDSAVSLFRYDPADGLLHLVDAMDDSQNPTVDSTGFNAPLRTDAILSAGLTAGDYYVAVSSGGNVPVPEQGALPGMFGIFDPNFSHSGQSGGTWGDYVLNLFVQSDNVAPQVNSVTMLGVTPFLDGATLSNPPTRFSVQFSEATNLPLLALESFIETGSNTLGQVFVQDSSGFRYYPHLESYDGADSTATFVMYDALPSDTYELHFSSQADLNDVLGSPSTIPGLTDLAGNALPSNDPSGDYVVHFTVNSPARGSPGDPTTWLAQEPNDSAANPQVIGPLFPNELGLTSQAVTIVQDPVANPPNSPSDNADYYQIQLLQNQRYQFVITGLNLPAGLQISVSGPSNASATGRLLFATLDAGTYTLEVSWNAGASNVNYQLAISLIQQPAPPPPLALGAGPAIRFQFVVTPAPTGNGNTGGGNTGGSSGNSPGQTPTTPPINSNPGSPPQELPGVLPTGPQGPLVSTLLIGTLASNSGTPTGSIGTGVTGPAAVPSSVLLTLGNGPLGGVTSSAQPESFARSDVYDRVLAQTPGLALVGTAVRLPVLLQSPESGTNQIEQSGDLVSALRALLKAWSHSGWAEAVELLHLRHERESSPPDRDNGDKGEIVFPEDGPDQFDCLPDQASDQADRGAAPMLALAVAMLAPVSRAGNRQRHLQKYPRKNGRDS